MGGHMVRDARKSALLAMRVQDLSYKTSAWGGAKRRLEGWSPRTGCAL